jgi:hypothetical protein
MYNVYCILYRIIKTVWRDKITDPVTHCGPHWRGGGPGPLHSPGHVRRLIRQREHVRLNCITACHRRLVQCCHGLSHNASLSSNPVLHAAKRFWFLTRRTRAIDWRLFSAIVRLQCQFQTLLAALPLNSCTYHEQNLLALQWMSGYNSH